MINGARAVLYETLRIQAITDIFIFFLEPYLFRLLKISFLYIPLFNVLLMRFLDEVHYRTYMLRD